MTIDIKDLTTRIPDDLVRPLYAGVGVTDLAVERVRELVSDAHKRATGLRGEVEERVAQAKESIDDLEVSDLREQATRRVNERVETLGKAAEQRQVAAEKRIASLQDEARSFPGRVTGFVSDNLETAGEAYADLAKRGETLVGRIRNQESTQQAVSAARTTQAKAKTTATQATKATTTASSAKAGTTSTARTAKTAAKSTRTAAKKGTSNATTTAKGGATKTAKTAKASAKKTSTTAKRTAKKSPATSSAKATATAAKKTASNAAQAAGEAASKVGD